MSPVNQRLQRFVAFANLTTFTVVVDSVKEYGFKIPKVVDSDEPHDLTNPIAEGSHNFEQYGHSVHLHEHEEEHDSHLETGIVDQENDHLSQLVSFWIFGLFFGFN